MRKLIVYGNCQAGSVYSILSAIPAITSRYEVLVHNLWVEGEELERQLRDFDDADIFLQQNVRNWRWHPLCEKVPDRVRVVRFPFCYPASLWPFDSFVFGPDEPMVQVARAFAGPGVFPFGFQDGLLARLRTEIPDPITRLARYKALDIQDIPDIVRYAEFEAARVLAEDRRLGFGIGQFMLDNFRQHRLFHAIVHPDTRLMRRLVYELLSHLRIEIPEEDIPEYPADYLSRYQVPVHPHVIAKLGLEWVSPKSRYAQLNGVDLNFDEYFTDYISMV